MLAAVGWVFLNGSLRAGCQITKVLGRVDQGLVDISAIALNATIKGSIIADPDACFVMTMALPFGSTRALGTAHDIST